VVERLSRRPPSSGRRGVYLIEMKLEDEEEERLKIVRLQRWGVAERLDQGTDLLRAVMETDEYTDYILDRRLGCRQLRMNLAPRVTARKFREIYHGHHPHYHGTRVWTPYFERDYIRGRATDKIPRARFECPTYAQRFAALLGQAAAPNIIVGRWAEEDHVVFDDGDEILIEDQNEQPLDIIVADITGSFGNYTTDLLTLAKAHAAPVNSRRNFVEDLPKFAETYVNAVGTRFREIQDEYLARQHAFDKLFRNQLIDEGGSFAYRWQETLRRLRETDPDELQEAIRRGLQVP
jgi:hypothetical protein